MPTDPITPDDAANVVAKADKISAQAQELAAPKIAKPGHMQTAKDVMDEIEIMLNKAESYSMQGASFYKQAIALYNRAIEMYTDIAKRRTDFMKEPLNTFMVGLTYLKLTRAHMGATAYMRIDDRRLPSPNLDKFYDAALSYFQKSADLDKGADVNFYHYSIGTVHALRGHADLAIAALTKAITANGGVNSVGARWRLAEAYEMKNDSKNSLVQLTEINRMTQGDKDAFFKIAKIHIANKDFDEATKNLKMAEGLAGGDTKMKQEIDITLKRINFAQKAVSSGVAELAQEKAAQRAAREETGLHASDDLLKTSAADAVNRTGGMAP